MTEFRVEFKGSNGREISIPFIIPEEYIKEIDVSINRQFVKTDQGLFNLAGLDGEYSIDYNDVVISQVGWLLKYREISYFFIDGKKKKFVIGIHKEE